MTRGSWRSFQASWPRPTSTAWTRAAPCASSTSVKPPVEAPISSADRAADPNCEMVERGSQLEPAARHPGMIAPGDVKLRIVGHRGAGLVDAPAGGGHQSGDDQRLRLRPAFGEAAVDEQLIGAPFRHAFSLKSTS